MARIFLRNDNWYLDYMDAKKNKRIRKSFKKDKKAAELALLQVLTKEERRRKGLEDNDDIEEVTIKELVKHYAEHLLDCDKSDLTIKALGQAAKRIFDDRFEYPADVTVRDIKKIRQELKKEVKPQTINNYISQLRSMFSWGMDYNFVKSNPFLKIENLTESEKNFRRDLDATEIKALLSASQGHYRVRWALYLYTGLRAENGNDISMDNIDMKNRVIRFPENMAKGKEIIEIPINDNFYEILKEYLETEKPKGDLFPRRSLTAIRLKLKSDLKKAGVDPEGVDLHALRHTFASSLLAAGVTVGTISKLLGHKNVITTERYLHTHINGLADGINRLKY